MTCTPEAVKPCSVSAAVVEDLHQKATLLSLAALGAMLVAKESAPALDWEEELAPIHDLAVEISVLAADLYLATNDEAAQQAAVAERDWRAAARAALEEAEGGRPPEGPEERGSGPGHLVIVPPHGAAPRPGSA